MAQLNVEVPSELTRAVRIVCAITGTNINTYVREALIKAVTDDPAMTTVLMADARKRLSEAVTEPRRRTPAGASQ